MGIGKRLEELMEMKGINAFELARLIDVPPTTLYSMIKRDSNRVDIDLVIKISHALGMTADEFLSAEVSTPTTLAAHFEGEEFTPEEIEEINNFVKYVKSKRN